MKEIIWYKQKTDFGCGPASMSMAYAMLGVNTDEFLLMGEMGTDADGTAWEKMILNPAKRGMFVRFEANGDWEKLTRADQMGVVIVAWMGDYDNEPEPHFSVVCDISPENILIADPGQGKIHEVPKEIFERKWKDNDFMRAFMVMS